VSTTAGRSLTPERLYALLPAVYRIRDAEQGGPLRDLLALIAQEFAALEEDIEQLYDDQFIETCADWVVPYIGDLIGYRPILGQPNTNTHNNAGSSAPALLAQDAASPTAALASPRAEVANTIAYRRRKGTAAMLEQLAHDVTGWPAHAAEFFEQLATTQYMKHPRLHARASVNLRSTPALLRQGGAFNTLAHTACVRRPEAGSGRYSITNVGLFLWRLLPMALSNVPLTPHDPANPTNRKFRFNPLGADQPLFRQPVTEAVITQLAQPLNAPEPMALRLLAREVRAAQADPTLACDYGTSPGRSASLVLLRANANPALPPVPVPLAQICICDLRDVATGWAGEASLDANRIAIDPHLGRVLLGGSVSLTPALLGSFHSGFSRAMGGGEYGRTLAGANAAVQSQAVRGQALQPLLDGVRGGGRLLINDSWAYAQTPVLQVDGFTASQPQGLEVVVAGRSGARPVIAASGTLMLNIGPRGRLVLQGLVISGATLHLVAAADLEPRELVLQHCTLVPGLALHTDGTAVAPGAPSLVVEHPFTTVTLEHCITGPLQVHRDASVTLQDCVVDAGASHAVAYSGPGPVATEPGATLTVRESTLVGKVHTQCLQLASNTLFVAQLATADAWPAPVWAQRKQQGCVRFCYVPLDALVPRRFRCVPSAAQPAVLLAALPQFTSLRYGDPGYMQLRPASGNAVLQGAADEGEIGVMHALFQPQREANLRLRLDEYLRFGLHAGLFYVT
jgi:hypothetical protein